MIKSCIVLLVLGASPAWSQSRVDLLQRVAEHYKNASTFQVKGSAMSLIPGTSWRATYEYDTEGAQPAFLPLSVRKPSQQVISLVSNLSVTMAVPGASDPRPQQGIGMFPLGQSNQIDYHLVDAQKIGEETVTVQGRPYPCEIIDAIYDYSPEFKPKSIIEHKRFSVALQELVVLRETRSGDKGMQWTGEVTSFSFDQPPSENILKALQRFAAQPRDRPDWVGRPVPDLTLRQLSGDPIRLSALAGHPVLLDFWGSYCGPCRRTTLAAQDLGKRYQSQGLIVLTLTEDTPADAKLWTDHYHVTLPVLLDPDQTAFKAFDIEGVPVAILIGEDGKVAYYGVGVDELSAMESVLKEKLSAVRSQPGR